MVGNPNQGPLDNWRNERDAALAREAAERLRLRLAELHDPGFRIEMGPNRPGFSDGAPASDSSDASSRLTRLPRVVKAGIVAVSLTVGTMFTDPESLTTPRNDPDDPSDPLKRPPKTASQTFDYDPTATSIPSLGEAGNSIEITPLAQDPSSDEADQ